MSLLTLVVMTGFVAFAQSIDFGLKGGLNLASQSNSNSYAQYQNRTGFHAGLFGEVHATPQISVQPEVVYSSQGTKYTDDGGVVHNLALNYVNVPVMLKANVGSGLYAQVGPQVGFLTGSADKVNGAETNFLTTQDFKSTDVAVGFGLGYTGTSGLGVDARYNLGLTNVNNFGTNTIKNNVLQIGLTYKLGSSTGRRY